MIRVFVGLCLLVLSQASAAQVNVEIAHGRIQLDEEWRSSPNPLNPAYLTLRSQRKEVEVNVAVKKGRELTLEQLERAGQPMHEGGIEALREELRARNERALVSSSSLKKSLDGWVSEWRGVLSNGETFIARTYIRRASTALLIATSRLRDEPLLEHSLDTVVAGMLWR